LQNFGAQVGGSVAADAVVTIPAARPTEIKVASERRRMITGYLPCPVDGM
jgi:hypothetical protein